MAEDPSESRSGRLRILVEPEASVLSQGTLVRKCQGRTSHSSRQRFRGSSGLAAEGPGRNYGAADRQRATQAPPQVSGFVSELEGPRPRLKVATTTWVTAHSFCSPESGPGTSLALTQASIICV